MCIRDRLADEREAVLREPVRRLHDRKEPGEDLPVPAHPAVLAAGVGEDAGRVVVHDLDAVSFTHLTPPTGDLVEISVVAGSLKNKKMKEQKINKIHDN